MRPLFLRSAAIAFLGTAAACTTGGVGPDPQPVGVQDAADRPRLANRGDAVSDMREAYPDLLRNAGVSGETVATFVVLPNGSVSRGTIRVERVTHEDFRVPARQVLTRLRFVPSQRGQRAIVRATLRWTFPQPDITVTNAL